VPRSWFPKVVACTQLLSALFYTIGIFSLGLTHFQTVADDVSSGADPVLADPESLAAIAKQKMRDLRTRYPRLDAIRKVFIRYVFGFSLLTQLVLLVLLELFDPGMFNSSDRSADALIIFIFFCAQMFQLLLVLLMSMALLRQIGKGFVSPAFIVQSWLATVSLFCGLYTLLFLLVPGYDAFKLWESPAAAKADHAVVDVVAQFFWFSLVTMTATGTDVHQPPHG